MSQTIEKLNPKGSPYFHLVDPEARDQAIRQKEEARQFKRYGIDLNRTPGAEDIVREALTQKMKEVTANIKTTTELDEAGKQWTHLSYKKPEGQGEGLDLQTKFLLEYTELKLEMIDPSTQEVSKETTITLGRFLETLDDPERPVLLEPNSTTLRITPTTNYHYKDIFVVLEPREIAIP